jgi:hypothetical protein
VRRVRKRSVLNVRTLWWLGRAPLSGRHYLIIIELHAGATPLLSLATLKSLSAPIKMIISSELTMVPILLERQCGCSRCTDSSLESPPPRLRRPLSVPLLRAVYFYRRKKPPRAYKLLYPRSETTPKPGSSSPNQVSSPAQLHTRIITSTLTP